MDEEIKRTYNSLPEEEKEQLQKSFLEHSGAK